MKLKRTYELNYVVTKFASFRQKKNTRILKGQWLETTSPLFSLDFGVIEDDRVVENPTDRETSFFVRDKV